jgi:hypothetical protein
VVEGGADVLFRVGHTAGRLKPYTQRMGKFLRWLWTDYKLSRNQCRECLKPLRDDTPRGRNYCSQECADYAQAF